MRKKQQRKSVNRSATLTIPELEQSKAAVLLESEMAQIRSGSAS